MGCLCNTTSKLSGIFPFNRSVKENSAASVCEITPAAAIVVTVERILPNAFLLVFIDSLNNVLNIARIYHNS
jgi:hypothetical protein